MPIRSFRLAALKAACCLATLVSLNSIANAAGGKESADNDLQTLPDFKIETVMQADGKLNGSWISLGKDSQGRLLLGAQRGQPATRLTLDNDGHITKTEVLKLPVSEIMGQLFVGDALYVDAAGKNSEGHEVFGLWRLHDSKGDGSYSSAELLREWHGGSGEHGAHGIVLAPDKQHIFTVCGNFTEIPTDLAATSPHKNYADDLALPRCEDSRFGAFKKPPGGFITRMNLDGKNAELFASGERNTYDIAFNADGELFGFDSDMEWDWGTPWYRPIRVFHAPSAADGGFREGTAKWPEYYPDSLPPVVDIGLGCPTGVAFGTGAKFPAKYQKAFYITDWTYGRLIAVHMKPKGASYECTGWENFVAPKGLKGNGPKTPLNLTDIVFGNDGAMYFTVGGRSTSAKLFRVTYTGSESTAPADLHDADGAKDRELRHELEAFHGRVDPKAVETAWPNLASPDRFIRYAARIAIEAQPVSEWKEKALAEKDAKASLTALLALARLGGHEAQAEVLNSLGRLPMTLLSEEQQLEKLRVIEVSIARDGKPSADEDKAIIADLDPLYPAKGVFLNRELCQVLLAINAPGAVGKTVKLLEIAPTQEEQLNYILALRTIKEGWTPELHKAYFEWFTKDRKTTPPAHPDYVLRWFEEAGRPYDDGASYTTFIEHIHDDAKASLSPTELTSLSDVVNAFPSAANSPKRRPTKVRALVKEWKVEDLEPSLASVGHGRNFKRGKAVFEEAQCMACHKFGNEGGAVGPDLTAVSSRFARKDILESIILPSKVISEQYAATEGKTKDGETFYGRLLEENADQIVLQPNGLKPERVTIKKADITLRRFSKLSPMPEGLVNTFTKQEILDLLAYVESGGRKDHPDFAK
ncbi:MAG TPA: c-type cytochrome [Tepidisphaeraceae bacterium]|jgi:putative heme-binding domain-containing protein|nr:c-type cytochrome [Tepidisphaeraceae bacterium]